MKLGLTLGYSGSQMTLDMNFIHHAEKAGFDSVWTSESYGSDAVSPAAYILALTDKIRVGTAIMQMPARTPTMTAMTAMTLDHLSGGRFILGLGPSGPQVAEGWYGESYDRPLTRLTEYLTIIRKVLERKGPLEFDGYHYQLPNKRPGTTGLGKPLKSILHGNPKLPIYTATMKAKALATSAELCDGVFPVWMNPERFDLFEQPIQAGLTKAGKTLADYDVAPFVVVALGEDLEACRMPVKMMLSLYIGGMGARGKNFYNDYAKQLGYEDAAVKIQDLYLDGKKGEAAAAVPDQLVDEVSLVGPAARIKDRLGAWIDAGKKHHVGSLLAGCAQTEALDLLAETVL